MTDKEKIREEVEKLKSQLLRGACSSQIAMETRCMEEAYNEVLSILNTMQEEPVSEDLEKENKIEILADIIFNAAKYGYMPYDTQDECCAMEIAKENIDKFIVPKKQEEPVSEKKCMFTKDSYTNEDRKVLCEDCKEKCEYNKKEPCIPDIVDKHFDEMLEDTIEKQFKVGDVVIYAASHIAYAGLYLLGNPNDLSIGYSNANEPYNIALRNCTVASEKEHKQFMRELESNGYKWNESSLRIEKKEGSVNEDLGEYINELSKQFPEVSFAKLSRIAVRVTKWQKEHLWKPADGDDLPEIDREVIAILDNGKVVYAHRPPEYWDGKNIITGKVTRNYPKTYDKGGWNIPDVKYWLDVELPKE